MQIQSRLWSDFSFVVSSGYRERVISSVAARPKLPMQMAKETSLRLGHVSRALRELREHGLVECLTPTAKGRGRLYALTKDGSSLVGYLENSSRRFAPLATPPGGIGFVPKIHATPVQRCIRYLKETRGEAAVREALKDWSVNPDEISESTWLSADTFDEFHELLEAKFGDGSYDFIRSLYVNVIPFISTVREQIIKVIPLEVLAERAPIVYSKEWNYGRLEVKTGRHRASFLHFDWMPTPALCAIFRGAYEGILKARKVSGKVTETKCVRRGDDHCEYAAEW